MNAIERIKMVKAMDFIARQVNHEGVFMHWLMSGVADGDVQYGDLSIPNDIKSDNAFDYVDDDETFAELMTAFLDLMECAQKNGGLYCDKVASAKE